MAGIPSEMKTGSWGGVCTKGLPKDNVMSLAERGGDLGEFIVVYNSVEEVATDWTQ